MIIFISDLHLSPERPVVIQAFLNFLKGKSRGAKQLYILGDFFDAWVGDDDDTPEFATVIAAIRNYQQAGTQVFFMHGNRDFLIGDRLAERAGMTLLAEPTVIELNQTPTLLLHGDSLCTRDEQYMAFRQQVRNPDWQQALLAKPLTERKTLAAQLRAASKSMNSIKADDIMDVTPAEVETVMQAHQTPLLIHGHTHRPARHALTLAGKPAERIVLGDWHHHGWYLISNNDELDLRSFTIAPD